MLAVRDIDRHRSLFFYPALRGNVAPVAAFIIANFCGTAAAVLRQTPAPAPALARAIRHRRGDSLDAAGFVSFVGVSTRLKQDYKIVTVSAFIHGGFCSASRKCRYHVATIEVVTLLRCARLLERLAPRRFSGRRFLLYTPYGRIFDRSKGYEYATPIMYQS